MKKEYITPSIICRDLLLEGFIAESFKVSDDEIGDGNKDGFTFAPKQDNYWGGADWEQDNDKD